MHLVPTVRVELAYLESVVLLQHLAVVLAAMDGVVLWDKSKLHTVLAGFRVLIRGLLETRIALVSSSTNKY